MPYIGRDLSQGNYLKLDSIESQFNGSKVSFALTAGGSAFFPGSSMALLVSVAGVIQEAESAFTIDQSNIEFQLHKNHFLHLHLRLSLLMQLLYSMLQPLTCRLFQ